MKKKIIYLCVLSLCLIGTGCSKTVHNPTNKEKVMISTEHNGIAGAEQDIKVITFDGKVLDDYEIVTNKEGKVNKVILNIK